MMGIRFLLGAMKMFWGSILGMVVHICEYTKSY